MPPVILIVDDSAFTRDIHRAILEEAGFEVIEAAGRAEALEHYKQARPALVVTDLLMPDADGLDVIRDILAIDPRARIIVCSTDKQHYRIKATTAAGALGFVPKPVDETQLIALARQLTQPQNG